MFQKFWNQPWILSITAGLMLALSFPPIDLVFLQFPAFILMFRLADLAVDLKDLLWKSWIGFLIWNVLTTYWLTFATIAGGAAAIIANSLLMVIPLIIIRYLLHSRLATLAIALLAGSVWVSYEFMHHNWDLAWPWLALGNGWANQPDLIQYISVTGHLAVSFWVIVTSMLFYLWLREPHKRRTAVTGVAVLILFPILSVISKASYQPNTDREMEVAVVQPNLDSYLDYGGVGSVDELLTLLFEISDSVRTENTDLLLWPENALNSLVSRDSRLNSRIEDTLRTWDVELITGAGLIDYYPPGMEPRVTRGTIEGHRYNIYNSGLHYDGDSLNEVYKKGKLVPIVERMPFVETFKTLDILGLVNWGEVVGYGKGIETNIFEIGQESVPALICYDSVFSGWVGDFVRNDATFLSIITNDGWWGNTSGHLQHFAYARLRAIEYRKWVARSANNGTSGIIAPDGDVKVATDYWTRTAFTYTIHPNNTTTLYARYGNWFNWLMIAGLAATALMLIRERRFKERKDVPTLALD